MSPAAAIAAMCTTAFPCVVWSRPDACATVGAGLWLITTPTAAAIAVSVMSTILIVRCMFILSNHEIRRSLYNARLMYHKEHHGHKGNGRRALHFEGTLHSSRPRAASLGCVIGSLVRVSVKAPSPERVYGLGRSQNTRREETEFDDDDENDVA